MSTSDPQIPSSESRKRARTRKARGPWAMLAFWLAAVAVLFFVGVLVQWLQ